MLQTHESEREHNKAGDDGPGDDELESGQVDESLDVEVLRLMVD